MTALTADACGHNMGLVHGPLSTLLAILMLIPGPAGAQLTAAQGADGVPYEKALIDSASVELPVPVDWVRLPAGDYTGVEAQYISVADGVEMSVFSIPFQCSFGPASAHRRASELKAMLAPTATWEALEPEAVRIDGIEGLVLRALWPLPDRPADVFAMAVPVQGRTTVVFVMMPRKDTGGFARIAQMFEDRTLVTEPPAEIPQGPVGIYDDGRGFSIQVPDGWRRILPEEIQAVALSAGVDPQEREPRETLGFVRPGIHRQSPNILVSMAESWMAVSEETLADFESQYRAVVGTRGSPFTLDDTSIATVAGRDAFLVTGKVEIVGATLDQSQYFVDVDDYSLILTFTVPATLAKDDPLRADVESMVQSVRIHGDEHAPVGEAASAPVEDPGSGHAYTWLIVLGLLVAAALVIYLVLRSGKKR